MATTADYPEGHFAIHSVFAPGANVYKVATIAGPEWVCQDANGIPVDMQSLLPSPYLKCFPPLPDLGHYNACHLAGNLGYGSGTGTLVGTTACSGGLSNSLTVTLPSARVSSKTSGHSALDYVVCTVDDSAVFDPPAHDWWLHCYVNLNPTVGKALDNLPPGV